MNPYVTVRRQRVDLDENGLDRSNPFSGNEQIIYSLDIPYSVIKQNGPNMLIPRHFADTMEILISCGSEGNLTISEYEIPFTKDSIVFIPPQVIHGGIITCPKGGYILNFKISPEHLNQIVNIEKLMSMNGHKLDDLFLSKPDYNAVLLTMNHLIAADDNPWERNLQILRLFELFDQGIPENFNRNKGVKATNSDLYTLLTWTEQHFAEPITVQDAADIMHLNHFYFCRFFKQKIGITYVTYLNQVRIAHAVKCLLAGDSAEECCYQCGFRNVPYFIQLFKKITGYTTREYLQLYQKREPPDHEIHPID